MNELGVNFAVSDIEGNLVVLCESKDFKSNRHQLSDIAEKTMIGHGEKHNSQEACRKAETFRGTNHVLAIVLESYISEYRHPETVGAALIDLGDRAAVPEHNQADRNHFEEMLVLLGDNFMTRTKAEEQIEMVSTELARVYEELVLLHKISTNMRLTEADSNFLQMACDSLTEIGGQRGGNDCDRAEV